MGWWWADTLASQSLFHEKHLKHIYLFEWRGITILTNTIVSSAPSPPIWVYETIRATTSECIEMVLMDVLGWLQHAHRSNRFAITINH